MVDVAYIALGSNVGDRHAYLARARAALSALSRTLIIGESSIEETAPLGPIAQGPYLNQMVARRNVALAARIARASSRPSKRARAE